MIHNNNNNIEILDTTFYKTFTKKIEASLDEGLSINTYEIKPIYGKGTITVTLVDGIEIIISNYKLKQDLLVKKTPTETYIRLSFLIKGRKIIHSEIGEEDIIFESQESYLVALEKQKDFRVLGEIDFKEVKIKLHNNCCINQGFNSKLICKELSFQDVITPMNEEILQAVTALENPVLKGLSRKLYTKGKVLELIALQTDNYKQKKHTNHATKTLKKVYQIRQIITENLDKNITICELSKELFMNKNDIKLEFKNVFGHSIKEFYTLKKMDKAQNSLKNTEIPIYEIAENIGYKNATHFTAAFKKRFGLTPKTYRNQS